MTSPVSPPVSVADPVNAAILAVSEDRIQGFHSEPFREIADRSGIPLPVVLERLQAMLEAGVIRRIRQTMLATNLAHGALVAWQVSPDRLHAAFDHMFLNDPFSGHVVIRSTDGDTAGSNYRLWTTVKVPQGYALQKHVDVLARRVGASATRVMPARRLFALGVGHVRRKEILPGSRSEGPAAVTGTNIVRLSEEEWRVLEALKRELTPQEVGERLWEHRALESGLPLAQFCSVARRLTERGVVGRFSTFLEHVKELPTGERVTRYNALFHWAVPAGRELDAGREVGRHHVLTHAYWREAGPEFRNVNIMAVAHGTDRDWLLAHKAAIDEHLAEAGIPVGYTNVFWGGRSEIKPSEISPSAYQAWCVANGIDPDEMREDK
ncbi:MAG TPA: winged helix-turn-helix transcriptional regulator [Tepidiformaceae bacterium]|nr:winged helix-turn-helix transcriptional regulator [Tepidiformaceae bacterium]